jgi:hypothetical protein
LRHGLVDLAQEGKKFLVPMPRFASSQDGSVENVERREQRRRSMANIVQAAIGI